MKANSKEQLCACQYKKTALATAIIATATTGFASVATAAERSELTIRPKEYTTFVRNFLTRTLVH